MLYNISWTPLILTMNWGDIKEAWLSFTMTHHTIILHIHSLRDRRWTTYKLNNKQNVDILEREMKQEEKDENSWF